VNGYKLMESAWDPGRHQWEFGIGDFDATPPGWPLSLTLQLLLSYSPAVPGIPRVRGEYSGAYEFTFGLRKYFDLDSDLQPHLSAGAGFLGASTTTSFENWWYVQEENQSSFGLWAAGGVLWFFSESNFTGVTLRWSSGVISLFRNEINAGGAHLLLHIGWRW
jgi:opacity protein-like surface antigen